MSNLSEVLVGYQTRKEKEEENMVSMGMDVANVAQEGIVEQAKYILVDTKPDRDTEWKESYMCNSWREAYEKMVCLLFDESSNELEGNLLSGKSFIKIYSAQTYDDAGDKHVFHIIGV